MTRARVHLALGSNMGDRRAHLIDALEAIDRLPRTSLQRRSALIETAPVGPPGQGPYLNAAAVVTTALAPSELLDHLLDIERDHDRTRDRRQRWGPRTLDLDILLWEDRVIDEPGLTVPHPRLHERRFALEPLAEIDPDALVPTRHRTVAQLLAALPDDPPPPR